MLSALSPVQESSAVELTHTWTENAHVPLRSPSSSQVASPSMQSTAFGVFGRAGLLAPGTSSTSAQSVAALPPPPTVDATADVVAKGAMAVTAMTASIVVTL